MGVFCKRRAARWLVASLAAYAMVLHAMVMGVAIAPRTSTEQGLIAALQEICAGTTDAQKAPGAPASSTAHAAPCALCGLGHAAVDLPSVAQFSLPSNILQTVALGGDSLEAGLSRLDFLNAARPRAPPAFV